MDEREKPTLKTRSADFAINALALVDGLLLTQPRNILLGYSREDENGRRLRIREALRRGTLAALPTALFPPAVGVLTYAVTKRPELAVAAGGVAYLVEGLVMDFCEAMAYVQSSYYSEGLYGRWTYSIQRKLAELGNYPKGMFPYWL